jgi:tetratricopeptide (TPR) repeat protein
MGTPGSGSSGSAVGRAITLCLAIVAATAGQGPAAAAVTAPTVAPPAQYAGSQSCRECHPRFYDLWSTSLHGLAMQPYSGSLATEKLTPQKDDVVIGRNRYRAETGSGDGYVSETGWDGKKRQYRIEYALGGKNVFYFLTAMDRGRLQTLPVAYDVRKKEWFDTALSGLRHFPGRRAGEAAVIWQEWPYTFNTSCYGCHVSQLASNYDPQSDSYATTWMEPGINCETCHGPCGEHNAAMRKLPRGEKPPGSSDFGLIRTRDFTAAQHNDACGSCHSKAMPLTAGYRTPERFFDHFDLVTLENPDFYPDGRDLGENYTQASWLMSPCVKAGGLHCLACHTSSGRYRFSKPEEANRACLPCHEERVRNAAAHTRHPAGSGGSRCIACHMPSTEFARMRRTDHSMLPPTPAASIAYRSPNACNGCHADRDATWADTVVRQWRVRDYQSPLLKRAALVDAARKREWSKLPEMLAYIGDPTSDAIFVTSLIRLVGSCDDAAKIPTLVAAAGSPSPLVRSAAVEGLGKAPTKEALKTIAAATGDDYRLVRVRAAAALAQFPNLKLQGEDAARYGKATGEYLAALLARPDSWDAHYNLGNYYLGQNRAKEAAAEYDAALKREPQAVPALVNAAMAHGRLGESRKAEEKLNEALNVAPDSAAVHYNLGLLKAEQGNKAAAEQHLKEAFRDDPQMAVAAYNVCILVNDRPAEALQWCRKAATLRPEEPRYAWTLAFYQRREGDTAAAVSTLEALTNRVANYPDAYQLLADIYQQQGNKDEAIRVCNRALTVQGMPERAATYFKSRLGMMRADIVR